MHGARRWCAAAVALVVVVGCSSDSTSPKSVLTSIKIQSPPSVVVFDGNTTLSATGVDQNGKPMSGGTFTWASSDTSVLTVSSTGALTTVGLGTSLITVSSGTLQDTATLAVQVGALPAWPVAAGGHSSCRLVSGAAQCWGENVDGELGNGTDTNAVVPTVVKGGLTFAMLAPGFAYSCGLTTAGAAYCWGTNTDEQLGRDSSTSFSKDSTPGPVAGGLTFTTLSSGDSHTCGLTSDGTAYCWGANWNGQIGDGTIVDDSAPTAVNTALRFVQLDAHGAETCGLTAQGAAYCWGDNWRGKLGDSTTVERNTPVAVVGGHQFIQLTGGWDHTCGLTTAHVVYCWGFNGHGELGIGVADANNHPVPEAVVMGGQTFARISTGQFDQLCGLTSSGSMYCWGLNSYGQVGDGTITERDSPVAVGTGMSFAAVSAGYDHTCALTTGAATYCWGMNSSGQVGTGDTTEVHSPSVVTDVAVTTHLVRTAPGVTLDRVLRPVERRTLPRGNRGKR